jgi:hypothetical protein
LPGHGDATDSNGRDWDVKTPNFRFPPTVGGSTLEGTLRDIAIELRLGENVIVDTKDFVDPGVLRQLKDAVNTRGWGQRVIWFP